MSTGTAETTSDDARFIHDEWDRRTRAHDIDGLLALYLPDAVFESPLVPRIMDTDSGVLVGHERLREFFARGTRGRPEELVRFHRSGRFLFGGGRLMWEYPRRTPDGDQVDIAEVMDLSGRRIRCHRIYWGWFGAPLLARAR
ncbi:nuclear transport factor 2 family protein [Tomitella gaofuii]|uniref:nuclear transport factor 2 family protein n=1 Tax=Tomitella gaofuii TaxID=2760083 RepID=UPI0015FA7FFE|nr:nuclear transport factor 2 family protein [Tomitella gaofuii]